MDPFVAAPFVPISVLFAYSFPQIVTDVSLNMLLSTKYNLLQKSPPLWQQLNGYLFSSKERTTTHFS
jgi:hypothetical protein